MPRHERSAGFVLYRDDPDVAGGRAYLLLDYGRHWDYPKGHVEPGEDDYAAAVRELREETGIADPEPVDGFTHPVEYYFRSGTRGIIHKVVVFFLAKTRTAEVTISHEHVGYAYLPYEAALQRLTYGSARAALRAAEARLNGSAAVAAAAVAQPELPFASTPADPVRVL